MKKVLLSMLLMMVLSVSSFAEISYDGRKERVASYAVQAQFANEYQNAENVTWTTTDRFQKVSFNLNGVEMTAFYNWRNEHVGTASVVTNYAELSANALKNLYTNYRGAQDKGYKIVQILKYTTGETNFFVHLVDEKENLIVKIAPDGSTSLFKRLK